MKNQPLTITANGNSRCRIRNQNYSFNEKMRFVRRSILSIILLGTMTSAFSQITQLQDYQNNVSAPIGTFQGISFREAGFSGLFAIPNTNGKEFWTISDRGVNVDAANANPAACRPTYDKIYSFPTYAPKIHRIRINGDSLQILQTITMKRPNGTTATGIINPTGFGSTAIEVASTDTVLDCINFNSKIAAKDIWGIDSEGIIVDKDGNFWICEEGGPSIWKLNPNGVVLKRYTPYANLVGAEPQDVQIDTVFKYRKNNRGFEGISIAPNGKIYAIIQSPILYPTKTVGEGTRIHRILEIDPVTNTTRMFAYLNDGIIGASGANQIRLRDWKIGDMSCINDSTFLVLEAALRGTTDIKKMYVININNATDVNSGLYSGVTLEALVDAAGLTANGIVPVQKTLFMDLLANGWDPALEKAEGLAIVDDSTIAICNDNDFSQVSPLENGIATATTIKSHLLTYRLQGSNKLNNYVPYNSTFNQGITGISTSQSPYVIPVAPSAQTTSILSVNDVIGTYTMCGIPDGLGAYDNNDGTFTLLMNHELGNTLGVTRAHGGIGAFVSKWVINKSNLSVSSGSDLMTSVFGWNSGTQTSDAVSSVFNFSRFCSADLPAVSAFYNPVTGLGTLERLFMHGEEGGSTGYQLASVTTGANAGKAFILGKFNLSTNGSGLTGIGAWENALACPYPQNKTIVIGNNDGGTGIMNNSVSVYVGTKLNAGSEVEKAGLTNGTLKFVNVTGNTVEIPAANSTSRATNIVSGTAFTLSGTSSTTFSRPEDGAWDPSNPSKFYFVTTDRLDQVNDGIGAQIGRTRLWRLNFTDITNPDLGGTIDLLLDGSDGVNMMDNMTIDNYGHILLQEDVGNAAHNGKIWQYTIATDSLKLIAKHDPSRFGDIINGISQPATAPYNQDEESSGIIDAQAILGPGKFLFVDQAHYAVSGQAVEGGQLLALYNPDTYNANPEISVTGNGLFINDGSSIPTVADNTDFGSIVIGNNISKSFSIDNAGPGSLIISGITFNGLNASEFSLIGAPAFPLTIAAGGSQTITVKVNPTATGIRSTSLVVASNDFDEATYDFSIQVNSLCTSSTATITGGTTVCQNSSQPSITFTGNNGLAPYTFIYTIYGGANSLATSVGSSVMVPVPTTTAGTYVYSLVSVTDSYGCVQLQNQSETVIVNPQPVATISPDGPIYLCGAGNFVYLTAPATTSYLWSNGATVQSIAVTSTGSYSVIATNTFGCMKQSQTVVVDINTAAPVTPGSILGTSKVCPGEIATYSVPTVNRAAFYTWVLPSNTSVLSGQGTNAITIQFNAGFAGGNLSVAAGNGCGISGSRLRAILVNTLTNTPSISGIATGVCGYPSVLYSVNNLGNNVSYNWTVPVGVNIISGQGTSGLTVDFDNTFNNGTLSVVASNGCNAANPSVKNISGKPSTPGVISGAVAICTGNTSVTYSVAPVLGSTLYNWTVPVNASIVSGQGTSSIVVSWPVSQLNASVSVTSSNACGNSAIRKLNGINVNPANCSKVGDINTASSLNYWPNPASEILNVNFKMEKSGMVEINLSDATGRLVVSKSTFANEGSQEIQLNLNGIAPGVYFLILNSEAGTQKARVIIE